MFPPEIKDAVDGMPTSVQIAIYTAALIFALATMAASVKFARKQEPHRSGSVVLQGFNASIADMQPIRDAVVVLSELLEVSQANARLLQEVVVLLRDGARAEEMERARLRGIEEGRQQAIREHERRDRR